jgi:hypothetical protein
MNIFTELLGGHGRLESGITSITWEFQTAAYTLSAAPLQQLAGGKRCRESKIPTE